MKRGYTTLEYKSIIRRLRAARPDVCLSSDFIVGFPGETEQDFEATMKLIEDIGFDDSYSFVYSRRPGTPAAERDGQVAEPVKLDRLHRLQALLLEQQQAFNASMVGQTFPVLLEKPGRQSGQMIGRSPYLQSVHMDVPAGSAGLGALVEARILGVGPNSLSGQYVRQLA